MLANEMILFYHVVKYKSFSRAAEKLNLSKAFVSKHISQLEKRLKTRLLLRSTRQLTLTELGEKFYLQCEKMVELEKNSYEQLLDLENQPSGTLKISVPPAIALHLLVKPLAEYKNLYPNVQLNIILESKIIDLVHDNYDLAIRSAKLPSSNLIAIKLGILNYLLCASPEYIEKYGPLERPEDSHKHAFALYESAAKQIKLIQDDRHVQMNVENHFRSNQLDLILQMVKAGCYIAAVPKFMIENEIANGQLKVCMKKYKLDSSPLYIIYPQREFMPLKTKLFIDLIKKYFANYLKDK